MLVLIFGGAGLLLGLLVGRWWALAGAIAAGLWIGVAEEVEIPGCSTACSAVGSPRWASPSAWFSDGGSRPRSAA